MVNKGKPHHSFVYILYITLNRTPAPFVMCYFPATEPHSLQSEHTDDVIK
jgi:hypothetical protein